MQAKHTSEQDKTPNVGDFFETKKNEDPVVEDCNDSIQRQQQNRSSDEPSAGELSANSVCGIL
jgi:hypothetical protein